VNVVGVPACADTESRHASQTDMHTHALTGITSTGASDLQRVKRVKPIAAP